MSSTTEQRIQDDMSVDSQLDDYLKMTEGTMTVVFHDTIESAAMTGYRNVACCAEIFDSQQSHRFACRGRIRSVVGRQQARIFFQKRYRVR